MSELVSLTKKLLVSPPVLKPTDLYHAVSIILETLEKANVNDSKHLKDYIQIASFLSALRATGLDHKAKYIAEAAKAVLIYSELVELPKTASKAEETVLDIVGTGGDGQNTFNVSTSAAIVVSGIPNIKVCKHGGKASTSNSGAGDLINVLGCDTSKINNKAVPKLWDDNKFMFLLAPYFHNGMKYVAEIRKLLMIPTIFNVLGPLLHPVDKVNKRVLGVYSKELALEYAKAAQLVYPNSEIYVVWGHVGLDEISPIGETTIWHSRPNSTTIDTFEINPSMFGLQEHPLSDCASYGPAENAKILREDILSGKYKLGDNHPIYDYILLNAAALYCLSQGHQDWKEAVTVVDRSIQTGASKKSLDTFLNSVATL